MKRPLKNCLIWIGNRTEFALRFLELVNTAGGISVHIRANATKKRLPASNCYVDTNAHWSNYLNTLIVKSQRDRWIDFSTAIDVRTPIEDAKAESAREINDEAIKHSSFMARHSYELSELLLNAPHCRKDLQSNLLIEEEKDCVRKLQQMNGFTFFFNLVGILIKLLIRREVKTRGETSEVASWAVMQL